MSSKQHRSDRDRDESSGGSTGSTDRSERSSYLSSKPRSKRKLEKDRYLIEKFLRPTSLVRQEHWAELTTASSSATMPPAASKPGGSIQTQVLVQEHKSVPRIQLPGNEENSPRGTLDDDLDLAYDTSPSVYAKANQQRRNSASSAPNAQPQPLPKPMLSIPFSPKSTFKPPESKGAPLPEAKSKAQPQTQLEREEEPNVSQMTQITITKAQLPKPTVAMIPVIPMLTISSITPPVTTRPTTPRRAGSSQDTLTVPKTPAHNMCRPCESPAPSTTIDSSMKTKIESKRDDTDPFASCMHKIEKRRFCNCTLVGDDLFTISLVARIDVGRELNVRADAWLPERQYQLADALTSIPLPPRALVIINCDVSVWDAQRLSDPPLAQLNDAIAIVSTFTESPTPGTIYKCAPYSLSGSPPNADAVSMDVYVCKPFEVIPRVHVNNVWSDSSSSFSLTSAPRSIQVGLEMVVALSV